MMHRSIFPMLYLILFACISVDAVKADDPIAKLPEYWKSMFEKESASSSRQPRFVGYLEGSLNIEVPQWWRIDVPRFDHEETEEFFSRQESRLEVNGDSIRVNLGETGFGSIHVQRESNGQKKWAVEINNLYYGIGQGPIIPEYALVAGDNVLYIFGREGALRFLVALSIDSGAKLGSFAYFEDTATNYAKPQPYGGSNRKAVKPKIVEE